MTDFDAVLFDAGGVLVLPSPGATGPLLRNYGGAQDEATLVRAHFAAAHAMDLARADGDAAAWDMYHRTYVRTAGVGPDAEAEAAEVMRTLDGWAWCHPMPGARDALAALNERGVPIGIVSNAQGQVEGELARLGICRRLTAVAEPAAGSDEAWVSPAVVLDPPGTTYPDPVPVACVVDSHVVGVAKPDPAIFRFALETMGLAPSARVAYVGDTVYYDVRAAAAAGLTPLLHDPFGFHAGDPHPSGPHRTLRRLESLVELVAA